MRLGGGVGSSNGIGFSIAFLRESLMVHEERKQSGVTTRAPPPAEKKNHMPNILLPVLITLMWSFFPLLRTWDWQLVLPEDS